MMYVGNVFRITTVIFDLTFRLDSRNHFVCSLLFFLGKQSQTLTFQNFFLFALMIALQK